MKDQEYDASPGMSLRDWFAGQALSYLATGKIRGTAEHMAVDAFKVADAMLAEREKGQHENPATTS